MNLIGHKYGRLRPAERLFDPIDKRSSHPKEHA